MYVYLKFEGIYCITMAKPEFLFVFFLVLIDSSRTTATQTPGDSSCSDVDLELIKAQRENRKFILDFMVPTLFPGTTLSDAQNVPLFTVYEKLAKRANRTTTDSGFSKFVEAVNEMTTAYTESCLVAGSSRFHYLENFTQIVQVFDKAYKKRKTVEIHSAYGKIVYLDDQINERRQKRQTAEDPVCDIDRSECKCPEGGMDNVVCPCEFFDCLNENNQLESIFIGFEYLECLAFVVDTTGSMKDEIDYTVQVIKNFIGSEEELGCYMFVPFNDNNSNPIESVGPVTVSADYYIQELKGFINTIENAFQPDSGGDCPEYSYHGIMRAFDSLQDDIYINEFGSQIIVLTDAPKKGDIFADEIISNANANEICVHFFLAENTYNCFDDYPGSVEEYKRIASETGGTVVDTSFNFSSFVQAYKNTPCRFLNSGNGRRKRIVEEDENCRSFQVSTLSSVLKLTVQTTSSVVTIHRPDKTVINITGAHFSEKNPLAGVWTICADEGQLEISPEIELSMDVTPLYFAQHINGTSILTCTAPPGCTMTKVAIYSSQSDSISSSQVQLLSRTGESTAEATLSKCSSSWSGEITTPDVGNYTYQIKGQDTSNNPFVYFTRRKVNFQSGEKYFNFASSEVDDVTAEIGDPVTLSFTLTSNNPFGSTTFQFAVEDLHGFRASVTPQQAVIANGESVEVTITLRVASYSVKPGLQYTMVATASNGCMTLSVLKRFTLTTPPTTAPPPDLCNPKCENGGTCVVIRRRYREFTRCLCPTGFIGRGCETRRA